MSVKEKIEIELNKKYYSRHKLVDCKEYIKHKRDLVNILVPYKIIEGGNIYCLEIFIPKRNVCIDFCLVIILRKEDFIKRIEKEYKPNWIGEKIKEDKLDNLISSFLDVFLK